MFFLTAPDTERLNIRGSRDPLGFVPLWGHFGRKVVQNLTTSSSSVRGFTTLLIGLDFAERVAAGESDKEQVRLEAFLKFEQLAGFARYLRDDTDTDFRGITQVKKRVDEGRGKTVSIGASAELQILSSQKAYGLWGLFINPAIESGLVVSKELVLTQEAHEFVDANYTSVFRASGTNTVKAIENLLGSEQSKLEPAGRHKQVFESLGRILGSTVSRRESRFYWDHLVLGGPAGERTGWQPAFVELMSTAGLEEGEFSYDSLQRIIAKATSPGDVPLRDHLVSIGKLEAFLVAVGNLFEFLQHRDGADLAEVCRALHEKWGSGLTYLQPDSLEGVEPAIAEVYGDGAAAQRLIALAGALRHGRYQEAVELTLAHNQFVMNARHGSQAWIHLSGSKLEVRYRDDVPKGLRTPSELASAWESNFYINPLKAIKDQLEDGSQ